MGETAFGLETVWLDLPALAGAFSRRLHDAGVPSGPEQSVHLARALTLVRPVSRRRLYWTARAVFVSDPSQVKAFDAVFADVFGRRRVTRSREPGTTSATARRRRTSAGTRSGDHRVR